MAVKKKNPIMDAEIEDTEVDETATVEKKTVSKPVETSSNSDVAVRKDAQIMKDILAKQGKVRVMIPLEIGEKKGAKHFFQINGHAVMVPKGVMTEVPETIAELIDQSWNINGIGDEFEIDGDASKETALGGR